ncbi:outer membrane lipoprotein carrier protein LolA [Sphingobacterium corticibacterium]|uniref:Outer membrane lipoprotein carrier protein LolA n=1 Tax=Sphingobacterium corticibacterium TaxID=2484746 RepID=A0A4Q6XU48_9SPHI|nr:outer membrane lipoprotein carrier protein LolA [Sphingobacterium corticibacterium]RZF60137.1 outer membrane lipoprotein carrier protein LolA [Sphingobacterium corticibacterium]
MNDKLLYLLFFLMPYCGWAQTREMTANEQASFQKSLQQLVEIKTVSADFVQYKHLSFMKKPVESAGKLYVKHPDKLSWAYTAPFQYKMVFKDHKIYIDDQGKKQTIEIGNSKQFEKISALVSSSLRGGKYDEKEFAVSYLKQGNADMVRLTPKLAGAKKYIKEIVLLFSSTDKHIEEVKLVEPSNDYTHFVIKNRKVNTTIDESIFNL